MPFDPYRILNLVEAFFWIPIFQRKQYAHYYYYYNDENDENVFLSENEIPYAHPSCTINVVL